MLQNVDCELLLYVDDTYLIFQHKDIAEIETALNKHFIYFVTGLQIINEVCTLVKIKQNAFCLAPNIKLRIQNH